MLVVAIVVLGGSGGRGAGGGEREAGVFHSETLSTTLCRMF